MPLLLAYVHRTYLRLIDGLQLVSGSVASSASVDTDLNYGDAQRYLQEHCEEHRAFWSAYVAQLDSVMDLSGWLLPRRAAVRLSDYKRIAEPAEQRMIIRDALYVALKQVCQQHGLTLNVLLQYAWHKVLHVYSGSPQTVVGVTVSGRDLPVHEVENSVGLFINTLPLIVDHRTAPDASAAGSAAALASAGHASLSSGTAVLHALRRVQDMVHDISSRSNVNLATLQRGGSRLFDCLFVYEILPNWQGPYYARPVEGGVPRQSREARLPVGRHRIRVEPAADLRAQICG